MSLNKKKVLIACPNGDGWIHKHVVNVLMKFLHDTRFHVEIILPTHRPFVQNLHMIQRDFLKGDYDFLISIDADNPPTNNVLDLIELDFDVVGAPTPVWHYDASKPEDQPY